jgi:hypothetical protein
MCVLLCCGLVFGHAVCPRASEWLAVGSWDVGTLGWDHTMISPGNISE